ncbi:hypothetical protein T06_3660 [Trichinella sp. T6]|nr:hypothetical protein T06_3660 [Trichinella sp. T6]
MHRASYKENYAQPDVECSPVNRIKCYAKSFFCFAARMAIVRSFAMQSAKVIPPTGRLAGSCSTFELRQLLHFH